MVCASIIWHDFRQLDVSFDVLTNGVRLSTHRLTVHVKSVSKDLELALNSYRSTHIELTVESTPYFRKLK